MQDPLEADSSSLIRILATHTLMLDNSIVHCFGRYLILEMANTWQMALTAPLHAGADVTDR